MLVNFGPIMAILREKWALQGSSVKALEPKPYFGPSLLEPGLGSCKPWWAPSTKVEGNERFPHQNGLEPMQMFQFSLIAPGTDTPLSYPFLELGEFPFLIIGSLG